MKINARNMVLVSLFAALTSISAFFKIEMPAPLAPITLQILFVILSGLLLGSKLGFASQTLYVLLGLIGVPVFVHGGGIGYILSPTFGFLLGFMIAAFVTGLIKERLKSLKDSFVKYLLASFLGLTSCYIIALPYMAIIFRFVSNTGKSIEFYLVGSFLIFMPGDILKIIVAAWLTKEVHKRIKQVI